MQWEIKIRGVVHGIEMETEVPVVINLKEIRRLQDLAN